MPAGATACLDCGWVQPESGSSESDEQPVLCTNPACGVANPPTERYCQRCNTMLPTAAGTMLQGRYQVERLLAIGGFGAVYLARDVKANRQVAIKDMICADAQEFSIRLNFFRREAEILRSLASMDVVPKVYDFIHQGQSAHLVMEFIRGENLLKLMENNNNRPFPIDLIVEWGKKICDVLDVMHSQSPPIVHRDLKPDNIMLLEDGKTIKLIDFGTARDIGRSLKTRLAAKTRVYTEGYAPPEQIIGKPEARSDLFALAGTMYHLATGKAPDGFYTARELEATLRDGNGSIPSEHRWFFELVRTNLAEDVNDRYFTAREIKFDLEHRRVTTEVVCSTCNHVNKVREPYCARCAAPLTEQAPACHQCGKNNRLGSRFCIHCGNRLR
jgi:serine/threonine protein kinase